MRIGMQPWIQVYPTVSKSSMEMQILMSNFHIQSHVDRDLVKFLESDLDVEM